MNGIKVVLRLVALAAYVTLSQGIAGGQSDDQIIAALRAWQRRSIVVVEMGDRLNDTVRVHDRLWEVYRVKRLATISGSFDPAEHDETLVCVNFDWSYDIPASGTIVIIAIYRDADFWFLEQETCSYMPNGRATLTLNGELFAEIDKCRRACAESRQKWKKAQAVRVDEVTKVLAELTQKYEHESKRGAEALERAQRNRDEMATSRARSRLEWVEKYYPDVVKAGKDKLAKLKMEGE